MKRLDRIKQVITEHYGLSGERAGRLAFDLNNSRFKPVINAVNTMIACPSHENNVHIVDCFCTFALQSILGLSYPETLQIADLAFQGLEYSAKNRNAAIVQINNGERIEFSSKIFDESGRDITEEKIKNAPKIDIISILKGFDT